MARVTVEDCENVIANRFDLVILAAQRARQIISGEPITLPGRDEKKPIIALREIAARSVSIDALKENVIRSFRTLTPEEDLEEDVEDMPEVDTYNPHVGLGVPMLESNGFSVVDDEELKNSSNSPPSI
ncbi:MAG: DNA-directed RNA polymerase subunit omega [Holosporaceae bacterium]|jgi:DNA-directed RNA polymerase subunit omega|nr:DNA-directed RNA polymerase subunit omega [Holosporaceae bacterium]